MTVRTSQSQNGFSLIEMVVALAIVALTLGTVYQISSSSSQSTIKTDNYLRALAVAQSRLAEISAQPVLQTGATLGSADGVAWSRSVRPLAARSPTPETRLYHIAVVATYRGSRIQLDTLMIAGFPRE